MSFFASDKADFLLLQPQRMQRTIGTMPALPTLCDGDCYPASLALMPRPGNETNSENPPERKKLLQRSGLENNFAKNGGKQQLNEERLQLFQGRYSKIHIGIHSATFIKLIEIIESHHWHFCELQELRSSRG